MFNPTLEQYSPVGSRVLLKVIGHDKQGDVWLPKTIRERWMPVVAVGSTVPEDIIKVGDMVLIGQLNMPAEKIIFGEEEFIQVVVHDIVGVVNGDAVELENQVDLSNVNIS